MRARRAYQESWEFVAKSSGNDKEYEDLKELIKKEYYSLSMEDRREFDDEEETEGSRETKTGDTFVFDGSVKEDTSPDEEQHSNESVPVQLKKQIMQEQQSDINVPKVVDGDSVIENITTSSLYSQNPEVNVSEKLDQGGTAEEKRENESFYVNMTRTKLSETHANEEEEKLENGGGNIQEQVSEKMVAKTEGTSVHETERTVVNEEQNVAFRDNMTRSELKGTHAQKEEAEKLVNHDSAIQEPVYEEIVNKDEVISRKETDRTVANEEQNDGTNDHMNHTNMRKSHMRIDSVHTKMHDEGLIHGQISEDIVNKTEGAFKQAERTVANGEQNDGTNDHMSRTKLRESYVKEDDGNTRMHDEGLIQGQISAETVNKTENMLAKKNEKEEIRERQNGVPTQRSMGGQIVEFIKTQKNGVFVNDTSSLKQHVGVNKIKTDNHGFKNEDIEKGVGKLMEVAHLHVEEEDEDDEALVQVEEDSSDTVGIDAFHEDSSDKIGTDAVQEKDEASKEDKSVDAGAEKKEDGEEAGNSPVEHDEQTESIGLHAMNESDGKDEQDQNESTGEHEGEDEENSDDEINDDEVLDFDDDSAPDHDDDDDKSYFKYDVDAGRFKRAIWDNDDDYYEGDDSVGGMNEYAPDDEGEDPHSIEERSLDYDDHDKQFDDLIEEQKRKDEVQEKRKRDLEAANNTTKLDPAWLAQSTDMMFDLDAAKEQINGMKEKDLEKLASAAAKALKAVNAIRETIKVIIKEKNMTSCEVRGASLEMDLHSFVSTTNGCAFPGTAYDSDNAEVDEISEESYASFDRDDVKGLTKLDDADQELNGDESSGKLPESSSKKEVEDSLKNDHQKQNEISQRDRRLDQAKRQASAKPSKSFSTPLPLLAVIDSLKKRQKELTHDLHEDQVYDVANLTKDEESPSSLLHSPEKEGTDSQHGMSDAEGKMKTDREGENESKQLHDQSQKGSQEQKKDIHAKEVYDNEKQRAIGTSREIGEAWVAKLLVKNHMTMQNEPAMKSKQNAPLVESSVGEKTTDDLKSQNEFSSAESSETANRDFKVVPVVKNIEKYANKATKM
eukprot:Seg167.14 transcript_id=Seg167.14/GoldUCD/mRNA.D3Y31 product="hypothetical protein" protein_id=Seg167.14/GoldUCD/D3Y31